MALDRFGLEGQLIDGQVRVETIIGEGGVSVVYKGHHLGLDEPVAVKFLKLGQALSPDEVLAFSLRFRDESRLANRLSQGNLNIVRSITSGTTVAPSNGTVLPYMALEWLEGQSLANEFRDRRALGRPFALEEAVRIFGPAVQALEYAHSQGVVHRDVTPSNLFLAQTREGVRLKVLDFGLAKILHEDAGAGGAPSVKTLNNALMCSPSYGAPEQFDRGLGPIGPGTDVYSLALVLIEALTNRKVRDVVSVPEGAILALARTGCPTPRKLGVELGDAVEALLARAVALDPSKRPRSAGELWSLLRRAVEAGAAPAGHAASRSPSPEIAPVFQAPAEASNVVAVAPSPPGKAAALVTTLRMEESPALPGEALRAPRHAAPKAATATPPPRGIAVVVVLAMFFLGAAALFVGFYLLRRGH